MLKIRDNIALSELKKYGFKQEPERSYYYKSLPECEIFVWSKRGDEYKPRCIYIQPKQYTMIIYSLDVLCDLIKADLIESQVRNK